MNGLQRIATALVSAAALGAVPGVAMAQQGVTDTEILLGEIVPLSGVASVGSLGLSAGTKMAIAEANAEGGINGRKARLISEDDGLVVARAVQGARKLLTGDKVFALTATSGAAASLALLPMLKETGIPAFNVLSFPEQFWKPVVPNIYVAGATHQDSAEQLAIQMSKRFPNKKWAMVTQDDEVGFLLREGFARAQKALNMNVVYTATFRRGQKDFSSEMLAATNAGAEVLFAGGILTENIAMVKELERLGSKIPVGISWIGRQSSSTLQMMGPASENVYLIDYVVPDESPQGRAFMERARRYLNDDDFKRVNRYSLTGYAGTKVMLESMRRCGKALTWACMIKELNGMKNFETNVMAPLTFTADSHFSKQTLMLMKANPKTYTYQPLE
ncbi:ABC transporter substrate-binding protein [soil metagenome]